MHISVATSRADTAERAVDEIAGAIGARPDFAAIYFCDRLDAQAVAAAAVRLGAGALHGGTSCRGVLAPAELHGGARPPVGVLVIVDPDGDYGTGIAPKGNDPRGAARQAMNDALAAAGRQAEAPDLVWLTATPGDEEEIIAGIQDVTGGATPVVGGSAADDDVAGRWKVIGGGRALGEAIAVSVLFPSTPLSLAFQNGYAPTAHHGVATRVEGRRLLAIDGRPAAEVYAGWTGSPAWLAPTAEVRQILAESTFAPLGRPVSTVSGVPFYLLAHPAALHPDGALDLFATVEEGETLTLMEGSPESLTARAGRVARQAVENGPAGRNIAGALVVYCGGCMLAVEEQVPRIVAGVSEALGDSPFLGVFTFGEQGLVTGGANRHGNLMVSCVVFAA